MKFAYTCRAPRRAFGLAAVCVSVALGASLLAAGELAVAQNTDAVSAVPGVSGTPPALTVNPSLESFGQLNQSFLSLYHLQNPLVVDELPLIVVIRSESMSAIEPDLTTTYTLAPQIREIKSALHAALGFQGLMTVAATSPSQAVWTKVLSFDADLTRLKGLVGSASADAVIRLATLAAIRELQATTRNALAQKQVSEQEVVAALQTARPHLMLAVEKIGQLSFAQMTATLRAIEEKVPRGVWDKAVVVVPGPATARIDNLAVMAAIAVLGEDQLGRRIFYSEGVYDDQGIIAFVQMLKRDQTFSDMLFGDPYRMWRDVFADTSRKHINRNYFTSLAQ